MMAYKMSKLDHCQYLQGSYTLYAEEMDGVGACHPIPPPGLTNSKGESREAALQACTDRCKEGEMCSAVNIVPAAPPSSSPAWFSAADQNVPWGGACPQAAFAIEPPGTQVCYGFEEAHLETETSEAYALIGDDAEDEIFFSTCYRKVVLSGFDLLPPPEGPPPPPPPPAPWKVGSLCLTCESAATGPTTGYWELSDTCSMCELDALPPGSLVPRLSIVSVAFAADGDLEAQRAAIAAVLGTAAGVDAAAVALSIEGAAVSADITVPAEDADAIAASLSAGLFGSPEALQAALDAGGVAGVVVTAITSGPEVTQRDIAQTGEGGVNGALVGGVVAAVAGLLLCLGVGFFCWRRRRAHAPPPPPPPGHVGTHVSKGGKYSARFENEMVSVSAGQPSVVPPPPYPPGHTTMRYA